MNKMSVIDEKFQRMRLETKRIREQEQSFNEFLGVIRDEARRSKNLKDSLYEEEMEQQAMANLFVDSPDNPPQEEQP